MNTICPSKDTKDSILAPPGVHESVIVKINNSVINCTFTCCSEHLGPLASLAFGNLQNFIRSI